MDLQRLLKACVKEKASDLHIIAGSPPVLRVNGNLIRVKSKILSGEEVRKLCYSLIDEGQRDYFEENKEIDFSFGIGNISRFRATYFYQKGFVSGTFRRIPIEVPNLKDLQLPDLVYSLADFTTGLVLITGPTGSGKSTTLAAIASMINEKKQGRHIVMLEDPIEYIHEHKNCIISQREIKTDTKGYKEGLRCILRQDPDICFLGELRDLESMEAALKIAETGHLVFATMHTNSAYQTINRFLSVFSEDEYKKVCDQLSTVLNAVLSQRLIPSNTGLVPVCEFLKMNVGMRSLIREGKMHQISGMMELGQNKSKMLTMNQSLANLILKRKIDMDTGFKYSPDPEGLDSLLKKRGI